MGRPSRTIEIPIIPEETIDELKGCVQRLYGAIEAIFSDDDTLLTEQDVATILRVSERTVRNWRERDDGPRFVKYGQSIRYPRAALRDWIRANTYASTTESQAA